MKRAVILHGTDGSPSELPWQHWLKNQLEAAGYRVYFPQLLDCHTPNLATYDEFLRESGWDFTDNIVIGHSSGATAALHLLGQEWFPHVRATVLVGTFLNERLLQGVSWYRPGQFDNLFIETFDPKKITPKSDAFYFVHGDNDPYCDYDEAQMFCGQVGGTFITMQSAGHLAKSSGVAELPKLVEQLQRDRVI